MRRIIRPGPTCRFTMYVLHFPFNDRDRLAGTLSRWRRQRANGKRELTAHAVFGRMMDIGGLGDLASREEPRGEGLAAQRRGRPLLCRTVRKGLIAARTERGAAALTHFPDESAHSRSYP